MANDWVVSDSDHWANVMVSQSAKFGACMYEMRDEGKASDVR